MQLMPMLIDEDGDESKATKERKAKQTEMVLSLDFGGCGYLF